MTKISKVEVERISKKYISKNSRNSLYPFFLKKYIFLKNPQFYFKFWVKKESTLKFRESSRVESEKIGLESTPSRVDS